jgi:hypothetical protein
MAFWNIAPCGLGVDKMFQRHVLPPSSGYIFTCTECAFLAFLCLTYFITKHSIPDCMTACSQAQFSCDIGMPKCLTTECNIWHSGSVCMTLRHFRYFLGWRKSISKIIIWRWWWWWLRCWCSTSTYKMVPQFYPTVTFRIYKLAGPSHDLPVRNNRWVKQSIGKTLFSLLANKYAASCQTNSGILILRGYMITQNKCKPT